MGNKIGKFKETGNTDDYHEGMRNRTRSTTNFDGSRVTSGKGGKIDTTNPALGSLGPVTDLTRNLLGENMSNSGTSSKIEPRSEIEPRSDNNETSIIKSPEAREILKEVARKELDVYKKELLVTQYKGELERLTASSEVKKIKKDINELKKDIKEINKSIWFDRYKAYLYEVGLATNEKEVKYIQWTKWLKKQESSIRLDGHQHQSEIKNEFIKRMQQFVEAVKADFRRSEGGDDAGSSALLTEPHDGHGTS